MDFKTEQEAFWAGEFGDHYIDRNRSSGLLHSKIAMWSQMIRCANRVLSIKELGCNIGLNLKALHHLNPEYQLSGVEINQSAAIEAEKLGIASIECGTITEPLEHKKVDLKVLNSKSYAGKKVKSLYNDFKSDLKFTNYSAEEINWMELDLVFLAVPHTTAMKLVPKLKCKVVDLSADYRFSDYKKYEKVYGLKHLDKMGKAVYGLPELFKEKIKKAKLVANPGCYVTSCILAALPIQKYCKYIVFVLDF